MNRIKQYLNLIRIRSQTGTLLLFMPCVIGVLQENSSFFNLKTIYLIFLFLLGSFIMRSAGCIINDLWDIKIDQKVERTKNRPLASGKISIMGALVFLIFLSLIGLVVLLTLNKLAIKIGLLIIPLIIIYPLSKRFFALPQLILGLVFNSGIIIGFVSFKGFFDITILPIYFALVLWTVIYDTIYAMQDKKFDLQIGIKSATILFGSKVKPILYAISVFFFILLLWSGFVFNKSLFYNISVTIIEIFMLYLINWSLRTKNYKKGFDFNILIGFIMILSTLLP